MSHFLIKDYQSKPHLIQVCEDKEQEYLKETDLLLTSPAQLLEHYVATDDSNLIMDILVEIRNYWLDHLSDISNAAEITGLIVWLLRENSIEYRGESLYQTAERLADMDLDSNTSQYDKVLFYIHDAIECLDELEAF